MWFSQSPEVSLAIFYLPAPSSATYQGEKDANDAKYTLPGLDIVLDGEGKLCGLHFGNPLRLHEQNPQNSMSVLCSCRATCQNVLIWLGYRKGGD